MDIVCQLYACILLIPLLALSAILPIWHDAVVASHWLLGHHNATKFFGNELIFGESSWLSNKSS